MTLSLMFVSVVACFVCLCYVQFKKGNRKRNPIKNMLKQLTLLNKYKYITSYPIFVQTSKGYHQRRSFFSINNLSNKKREYVKKELIGYSMQEMYSVVADVKNYYTFVPYVKKSRVHSHHNLGFKADLIVGFPPINEAYTSRVTLNSPNLVMSECNDGRLFSYLLNEWRFSSGLKDIPQSCVLDFRVAFEFKSLLHSNIANLFFDLICDQMESAFLEEARRRFGEPSIRSHILSSKRS